MPRIPCECVRTPRCGQFVVLTEEEYKYVHPIVAVEDNGMYIIAKGCEVSEYEDVVNDKGNYLITRAICIRKETCTVCTVRNMCKCRKEGGRD